jgi:RND family efflux transporter MFP subunit
MINMTTGLEIRKYLQPALIVAAGVTVAFLLYLTTPAPVQKTPDRPVLLVDAIQAVSGSANTVVKTQGAVTARTRTALVSEVSGIITRISPAFVVGGYFRSGDVLVEIDDRNYLAELKRARAAVASARTQLAKESGLAEYALADWERSREMVTNKEMASELTLRKPQLQEARANLEFAEADLIKKQGDMERTKISLPYDGIIEERNVDLGQFVTAGTQLAISFAIDSVEVRLPIPVHELDYLELPDPLYPNEAGNLNVNLESIVGHTKRKWHGKIVRTEAVLDSKSRVLYVVAQVRQPYRRGGDGWDAPLRIGTFVDAIIEGKTLQDVVVLPRAALRPGNRVWVIDSNQQLQMKDVEIARADEDSLYISSGINDGQLVCMTSLDNPLPGTRVQYTLLDMPVVQVTGDE